MEAERFAKGIGGQVVGRQKADGTWECSCGSIQPDDLALYHHRMEVHGGEMSGLTLHDYGTGDVPEGRTWNTDQLRADFEVISFFAPFVAVRRKSDGVKGSLQFTHSPRVYFNWTPA